MQPEYNQMLQTNLNNSYFLHAIFHLVASSF